jgi:hypothetical protein
MLLKRGGYPRPFIWSFFSNLMVMSTLVRILSHEDTRKLIEWIRQKCCSSGFDPLNPDFQAAIALLATSDCFRQAGALRLTDPGHLALVAGSSILPTDVPLFAQILLYRSLIRHIPTSPQTQRAAMKSTSMDLAYLHRHADDVLSLKLPESPAETFRSGFITGRGHAANFLINRRAAILGAAMPRLTTSAYRDMVNVETRKLQAAIPQHELREKLCRFALDPLGQSLPDVAAYWQPPRAYGSHLSPHHVGIIPAYDMPSSVETSPASQRTRQVLAQAHKFLRELAAATNRHKAIKADLELYRKEREKERLREKKNQEKMR